MTSRLGRIGALAALVFCLGFTPGGPGDSVSGRSVVLDSLLKTEAALLEPGPPADAERVPGPSGDPPFGVDPWRITYLETFDRFVVLLRGSSQILLCDRDLKIVDRCSAPRGPVAWDLWEEKVLFVGGELSDTLRLYEISPDRIASLGHIRIDGVPSIRGLAFVPEARRIFLLDDFNRRLVQVDLPDNWRERHSIPTRQRGYPIGPGPLQILGTKDHLIINRLLDHSLLILPLRQGEPDFDHAATIGNAGPFWSMAAVEKDNTLVLAAGGIENHPFSRATGEFGYLDSFLFLFTLTKDGAGRFQWQASDREDPTRFRSINLSRYSVLTPKALSLMLTEEGTLQCWVAGYGGDKVMAFSVSDAGPHPRRELRVMPGASDFVVLPRQREPSLAMVSPLLDRVTGYDLNTGAVVASLDPCAPRSTRQTLSDRLGELLFYTDLMSPNNTSSGELSRFTCEACHFEGGIDGRVHFTGRGDVHATTKPIAGLAHNVPLFSRAGDETLSAMVMAEFLVANQHRQGNFVIQTERHPWMSEWFSGPESISPLQQRESLLAFFVALTPKPNPWRIRRKALSDEARRGLAVFRERCADCHQPIESTRTGKGIPFDEWEKRLTGEPKDLIWGAPFMARTGIEPYVDPAGARVPSLRRVWMKYPLFTDGSSPDIRDVLRRFRFQGTTVWHHLEEDADGGDTGAAALTPEETDDLENLLRYF